VGIIEQSAGKRVFSVKQVVSSLECFLPAWYMRDLVPEKDCNLAE